MNRRRRRHPASCRGVPERVRLCRRFGETVRYATRSNPVTDAWPWSIGKSRRAFRDVHFGESGAGLEWLEAARVAGLRPEPTCIKTRQHKRSGACARLFRGDDAEIPDLWIEDSVGVLDERVFPGIERLFRPDLEELF